MPVRLGRHVSGVVAGALTGNHLTAQNYAIRRRGFTLKRFRNSGASKSTLAKLVAEVLAQRGLSRVENYNTNIRCIGYVCNPERDGGIAIAAAIFSDIARFAIKIYDEHQRLVELHMDARSRP